ncbi:hypothetical protein B296_00006169 [Ensete ventricosum]|uniref:Uncharacterized protein n=1 Tax=Ensete ventricosum TaxID=4639 RepID=A0A427AD69_ENSVE|nr:hypothetical protein B296_00006169 [Ensete ventricosum]
MHSSVSLLPPSQRSSDPRRTPFLPLPAAFHCRGLLTLPPSSSYASSPWPAPLPTVGSIVVGPLPLKHQQRCRYLAVAHLLDAPHDAAASSLVAAALAAATAPLAAAPPYYHRCPFLSLLAPHPVAAAIAAPPCRRRLLLPLLPTSSPTSFSTYWRFLRRQSRCDQVLPHLRRKLMPLTR